MLFRSRKRDGANKALNIMSSSLMTSDMLDHSKLHKYIRINIYAKIAKGICFLCHETK